MKPDKKSATNAGKKSQMRGFITPERLFFLSGLALVFLVGLALGVASTWNKHPLTGLAIRSVYAMDGFFKTGMFAPPQLFVRTPENAPPERIFVANKNAPPDGWRAITAYDKEANLFLVRLFDHKGALIHIWRIADPALSPDGFSNTLVTPHGLALTPQGVLVVNSDRIKFAAGYDQCSNELWRRDEPYHHQMSVDDDGYIWSWRGDKSAYSQSQTIEQLDPSNGQTVRSISLIDDIIRPHAKNRALFGLPPSFGVDAAEPHQNPSADIFHPNDVEPLPARFASQFPQFNAGDLLVSFRNLNLVAVIDHDTYQVKWSLRGPWSRQHDPDFISTGEISVFNNNYDATGTPTKFERRSTIVAVNPATGAIRSFLDQAGPLFFTAEMGAHTWLPGKVLQITSPHEGRVFEVDLATGNVLFDFNNRLTDGYSGNVATADWFPEGYFDEDPSTFSCSD